MKKVIIFSLFVASMIVLTSCGDTGKSQTASSDLLNSQLDKVLNDLNANVTTTTQLTETNKTEKEDWAGTYVDKFGRTLKIQGPASDGAVKFELTQQNSASCAEEPMEGTAYLTNQSVANWQEEGGQCHLSFTYNPGSIEVIESDCMHGASCGTFDGFYDKKK
jgi:hypothetical protein